MRRAKQRRAAADALSNALAIFERACQGDRGSHKGTNSDLPTMSSISSIFAIRQVTRYTDLLRLFAGLLQGYFMTVDVSRQGTRPGGHVVQDRRQCDAELSDIGSLCVPVRLSIGPCLRKGLT